MATKKQYIVQPAEKGGFEVKAKGGIRASVILPTQAEAEERAQELNPENRPNVRGASVTRVLDIQASFARKILSPGCPATAPRRPLLGRGTWIGIGGSSCAERRNPLAPLEV
jgi:hypothetical protein